MKLLLKRIALRDTYTIGKLYVDGVYFCDTLEDKVRDLNKNGKFDGSEKKIMNETAIPYGEYGIVMNVVSPKFSQYEQYKFCNGKLPRLTNVTDFEGVLIHIGNTPKDTSGCILVGENKVKGQVINSTNVFKILYTVLDGAYKAGESITIEIK